MLQKDTGNMKQEKSKKNKKREPNGRINYKKEMILKERIV